MTKKDDAFVKIVLDHYKKNGRHELPWRKTKDPYRILVSEMMLQQTQVSRVIPKYKAFIKQYPTARTLSRASLGDVLRAWQGLGYNRRAKLLYESAQEIVSTNQGMYPRTHRELTALPGIGPYTAGAVMAFAYNEPVVMIETNIRSVYLHHFFKRKTGVSDEKLSHSIERTLDRKNPREWYWALMDYGAYLKRTHGNANRRSKRYVRQSTFSGSDRQIRGAVLRELSKETLGEVRLLRTLQCKKDRAKVQLSRLLEERLILKQGHMYSLPE